MKEKSQQKIIIKEAKGRKVATTIFFGVSVLTLIFFKSNFEGYIVWPVVSICAYLFIINLLQLLNSNHVFANPDTLEGKQIIGKAEHEIYSGIGIFNYTENGFEIPSQKINCTWSAIESLLAFKEDRFTTDEICLDIIIDPKNNIRISESVAGWHQFIDKMKQHFPSIPLNWEAEIAVPAFATNLTLLYDKRNRSLDEVVEWSFS